MDADFWHQKWDKGEIGFHQGETNPFLAAHFEKLNLAKNSRIFLPLCGKTRDIAWCVAAGYQVVGVELSERAIKALFTELGVEPSVTQVGLLTRYHALNIDIFVGDIFDLSAEILGSVDAVYDRAALVALHENLRSRYTQHLIKITNTAPQLLITYEYDQTLIAGPPFSVNETCVKNYYDAVYLLTLVERQSVEGGLKGKVPSAEPVWLLQK